MQFPISLRAHKIAFGMWGMRVSCRPRANEQRGPGCRQVSDRVKSFIRNSLIGLLCSVWLGGCVLHVGRPQATPPTYRRITNIKADPHFSYSTKYPVHVSGPAGETRYDEVMHLWFQSTRQNGQNGNRVDALYFRSKKPGPKKLVIVLPIWGTSTYPPSKIAHGYAKHSRGNADTIWILGNNPLFPWKELADTKTEQQFETEARQSAERFQAAVVDLRRLVDWAQHSKNIDGSRIGVVGFSMSALVAATLMGNEPRIEAGVLMLGGANFADIFSFCGDKAGMVRQHAMTKFGWSLQQYRVFFSHLFAPADPINYRGHYNPNKLLMINAKHDQCIPPSAKEALWQLTGRPQRMTLFYGHRHAFYSLTPLGLNMTRRKIFRFFDRVL